MCEQALVFSIHFLHEFRDKLGTYVLVKLLIYHILLNFKLGKNAHFLKAKQQYVCVSFTDISVNDNEVKIRLNLLFAPRCKYTEKKLSKNIYMDDRKHCIYVIFFCK